MDGEPLDALRAKQRIREILEHGEVKFSSHARQEMVADRLVEVDVVNVLRAGVHDPAELERGSWRYRVRSFRIVVVIAFVSDRALVVVTAWRLKK